jgi:SulP family sulfate permease
VLSALAIQLAAAGTDPGAAMFMLALVGLMCGLLQVLFGVVRLGRLIKYMPYPVVSGYLSGVGIIIILSQVPKILGGPIGAPAAWTWPGIVVGAVTIAVMVFAPKATKAVPAAILALAAGVLAYFAIGVADRSLLTLDANKLVVGPVGGFGAGFFEAFAARWKAVAAVRPAQLLALASPAITLAVLLSIDTLKTCVVLDALTRSRHDSNRELVGQGLGNLASTAIGGVPGAGTMGATLVNLSSGGNSRLSGIIAGVLALVAFLLLGRLLAWIPIAALAGILIVVGARMIDWHSLQLLRSKSTIFDFAVILAVVLVAETVGLIAASATGIGLAVFLFIREQVRGSVVRRKVLGNEMFSRHVRLPEEMAVLEQRGDRTAIFELQGSLFFGTTDQLYAAVEPELKSRTYIVFDMRRVQSVDFTAAHALDRIEDSLKERSGFLIFCHFAQRVPSGRDLVKYFEEVGLRHPEQRVLVFDTRSEALEWIEERILEEARVERAGEKPLELTEMDLFRGRREETLAALEACLERRSLKAGETLFTLGEGGDDLFLIRRGTVRIVLPVTERLSYHVATFGRGSFFGEMAFLDREPRSANAVAHTDVELYVLSRARFDGLAAEHKKLGMQLLEGLAHALAIRLRRANKELRALQEG